MSNIGEKVNNLRIAYIGGGSMNWAWELIGDLALDPQLSGVVRLYDINYEAAKANEIIGNRLKDTPDAVGKWDYEAKHTLEETLKGADFVVISILPGTFDEMESDVHTPEKYGVYQSVGDTTGPGGIVRAMRTIPMYVVIAEAIKAYCPQAWVINYTNPMSVCTGVLYKVFPGIKAFGCCHEVFHTQKLLAKMFKMEYGLEDVLHKDIHLNVLGVNHFVWVTRASYKTLNLMPLFKKYATERADSGFPLDEADEDPENCFKNMNRVCFDLYKRFNVIPAAGDRHIAEFMPPWYLKSPEAVKNWGFNLTPVKMRKLWLKEKKERSARLVSGEESFELRHSGEEGTVQIKAILGLGNLVTNVNLPNKGQQDGLPAGAIVETNALFELNSVTPVFAGKLPEPVNAIVLKHAVNQNMLIEAGIKKDKDLAFGVFLNDNLVTPLDVREAEELYKEMLDNTRAYLEGWGI